MLVNQSLIHAIPFFTTEVTTYLNYYSMERGAVSPRNCEDRHNQAVPLLIIILIETIKMTIIITTITMEEESTNASQSS